MGQLHKHNGAANLCLAAGGKWAFGAKRMCLNVLETATKWRGAFLFNNHRLKCVWRIKWLVKHIVE